MRNVVLIITAIALALIVGKNNVLAQETTCIDQAKTNIEVNKCGDQLVTPREAKVDNEFNRLSDKFKNNNGMQEMLRLSKQSWNNYRNIICNLEGAAAAGGQTSKPLPVEANKAFLRCVVRTLEEMEAVLGKY